MHRADNLTTFICWLSLNLAAWTSWNPQTAILAKFEKKSERVRFKSAENLVHLTWNDPYCAQKTYLNVVLYGTSSFAVHRRHQPFVTFSGGCSRSNEVTTLITSCVSPRLLLITSVVCNFLIIAICHTKVIIAHSMFSNSSTTREHSTQHIAFFRPTPLSVAIGRGLLAIKVPLTSQ